MIPPCRGDGVSFCLVFIYLCFAVFSLVLLPL